MKEQQQNSACSDHPTSSFCQGCPSEADLGVVGSPCHPYSTQRSNRYSENSVSSHPEFGVSMEDTVNFIQKYEPKLVISEQVRGFDMPIEAGGTITPYQL